MIIKPLTKSNLNEAINLVINIFDSKPTDFDAPQKWLPASLDPKRLESKERYKSYNTNYLKYYVGIDEKSGKVIGTTGIYTLYPDEKDSAWLAYYCVDPNFRGKGYGTQLLDYVISLSKKMGKKYLKLYTSYNLDIKKAMKLYEKRGFSITEIKNHPNTKEEMVFMTSKIDYSSDFTIKSLSKSTLKSSLKLLDSIFGADAEDKMQYTRGFNTSLGSKKYLHLYPKGKPSYIKYFTAVEKKSGKVVGTVGLYSYEKIEEDNSIWLGWFCVDPNFRGRGIGEALLDFAINKAKYLKKGKLKLWTSNDPKEKISHFLYKKKGFIETSIEKRKDKLDKITMELKL